MATSVVPSFKEQYTFDQRHTEAHKMLEKFTTRRPIIVEKSNRNSKDLPVLKKHKFLSPSDLTVGQFVYIIRKQLTLPSETAIFMFVRSAEGDILPTSSTTILEIYKSYSDEDGFIYMSYCGESTFG